MKTLYCSRCGIPVGDETMLGGPMTAGFYYTDLWKDFFDAGDVYVCDRCMWTDPRYREAYGRVSLDTPIPMSFKEIWLSWREAGRDFLRLIGWYRKHHHVPRTRETRSLQ